MGGPEKSVDVIKVFDRVDGSTLHRKVFERGQYLRNCYTEEKRAMEMTLRERSTLQKRQTVNAMRLR